MVALASGHALEYVNALERNLPPTSCYDFVDSHISSCIAFLLANPQPATWLHCDAIALGFCSNLLLQQAQAHYLAQLPPSPHLAEQREKADLALRYGRRMAWDMVKNALDKVESEEEVAKLPFAALCCVLRAGITVLETAWLCGEFRVDIKEIERLQRVVGWFGKRWGAGREFEVRLANNIVYF
jgi:hypothetical protein